MGLILMRFESTENVSLFFMSENYIIIIIIIIVSITIIIINITFINTR